MKIIHFIASIDRSAGGTTAYMQLLAQELSKKINIIVATGISSNPVKIKNVTVMFFDTGLTKWFSLQKKFTNFLKAEKPDLVHINGIWNPENWWFQKAAQQLGIKVILSPHGMLAPYILNRHPFKKKIALGFYQDKALKSAEFLHCTAKHEFNDIQKLGYKQTIAIISNGIELTDFPIVIPKKTQNPKKILFLSRIHGQKGVEFLIEAWSNLPKDLCKDWIVEIIGNGEQGYINILQQKINNSNLQEQILIKPPVFSKEKIKIFRNASLFVLPTYSENFGIVVAEALASYTPVITTKGTPWEELNTYNAGWWVNIGVEPLKEALIIALKTDNSQLIEMGKNGRELIAEKYSIEAVAEQMISFYYKNF